MEKMADRFITAVVAVLVAGILGVLGNALSGGALISALGGVTKAEIMGTKSGGEELDSGQPGASIEDVVAKLRAEYWDALKGQKGDPGEPGRNAQLPDYLESLNPYQWRECRWVEHRGDPRFSHQKNSWCPSGGFMAGFDLDGCASANDCPVVGAVYCCWL